jgi:uncharacterized protein (DUF302 family)
MTYSFGKTTSYEFQEAIDRVTEELKKEGFGVLTTIDVQDTLKKKINVEFKKYVILGACNPPFAHAALSAEEEIGLLLPCNVIVYEKDGSTVVRAFDPMTMVRILETDSVTTVAKEVEARLRRVIAAL